MEFDWLRDATQEDIVFWKGFLSVESDNNRHYNKHGIEIYGMTDEKFANDCIFYEQWLKLNNQLFYGYYVTNWDHLDYVPYVVSLRYYACFAAGG